MGLLVRKLAEMITKEEKVTFFMKQDTDFLSNFLGMTVEEIKASNTTTIESKVSEKVDSLSAEELFASVTPDMMKKHFSKK